MGNNASKTPGETPSSPVITNLHSSNASHASHVSPNQHRRESKARAHASAHHSPSSRHTNSVNRSASNKHRDQGNMGNDQSRQRAGEPDTRRRETSGPVGVPRGPDRRQRGPDTQFETSGPPRDLDYIPPSNLNFPPRLPLPIGEEDHTPGSPIITPADLSSALIEEDVNGVLPRQISVLSSTTVEDDDVAGDELQPYSPNGSKRTVPTTVRWKQGGDRIYVTGTFTMWSRKYRMHRESVALDLTPSLVHMCSSSPSSIYPYCILGQRHLTHRLSYLSPDP